MLGRFGLFLFTIFIGSMIGLLAIGLGGFLLMVMGRMREGNEYEFDFIVGSILMGLAMLFTLFLINEIRIGWLKRQDRKRINRLGSTAMLDSFSSGMRDPYFDYAAHFMNRASLSVNALRTAQEELEQKAYEDALDAQLAPKPKRVRKPKLPPPPKDRG